MAQKRAGRGRPRKSPRAATGFPVTRRRSAKAASSSSVAGEVGASSKTAGKVGGARSAAGKTAASPAASSASSSNEPTSAFEALCQVTSAEYERLSGSAGHGGAAAAGANRHNNNNSDNRSDASSKSTEENRQVLQSPSDVQLPAWYGAHIAPSKPYKSELILPPKKKKYLHYLAESEDDNQIINNPFPQHPHHEAPPPRSLQESPPVAAAVPVIPCATTPSSHHPLPLTSGAAAVFSLYPYGVVPQGFSPSPEQLAPLKFNPTPPSSSRGAASACPDTKTFSDVLDEHISRLIIQNDVIVSKQPAVVMSKRGRSRDAAAGGGVAGDSFGAGEGSSTLSSPLRTHAASTAESMVKTLLSSKITRKTMLKENSASRQQQARPSGTTFSYLNPENSAIKDLLIKTYEEKGISSQALQATQQQQQQTPSTANPSESVRESSDYTTINSQQQQRQFKTPSATTLSRTGCPTNNTTGSGGIVYGVSSDQRSGALVVPDMRHGDGGGAAALNSSNNALVASGWIVSPGNEWVSVDDRGRRRVRPEVTVCPESTTYCLGGSSAATAAATAVASPGGGSRSLRSPSMDSMQSSESSPSSVSFTDSRRVHASGTFQPYRGVARGGLAAEQDGKMRPPSAVMQQPFYPSSGVVKTAGTFHPTMTADGRVQHQEANVEVVPESHEKTLNALRGHLTGRRPTEDSITPKSEEGSIAGMQLTDRSSLPPKKRKSFHVPEEPVAVVATPPTVGSSALALEPISPALPLDESRYAVVAGPSRQTVIQEPGFSGYATYVNENQPSHLGFYSDLSRQYSTNVAFAQTLLQQGHYYPSFRYSCVTTNAIRGGRPIHVPNGESTSMYANWTAVPSVINPTIRVDSSGYGKKKTDNTYYSLASKRSVNVGATSVETYTRKRQLILNGRNSFLPGEALRLMQPDVVPTVRPDEGQAPSTFFFRALDSTQAGGGARLTEGIKVEDVSEDEDEDVEKVACTDCGRFFPKTKKLNKAKFVCLNCKAMGRSRAETMPKQARPVPQSRRPSEAVTRPDSGSSLNDHENRPSGATGKPLMAQLKQKIIGHQQPGPSSSTPGSRSEMPFHASEVKMETDEANFAPSSVDHDAMDLSVKKTTAPVVAVPDWRTMEGAGNRFPCRHCPKIFNKEGQLYLHNRVHEIDTAGKGERKASKAKSERCSSPGSVSATNENPRPFFCAECTVGFRIHGHLQKHLRSKGHITQLECLNRLPCGFYAELERQNMIAKLHTIIDTADCAKAFSCLNQLAKTVTVGATLPDEPSLPAPSVGDGVPSSRN